MKAMKIIICTRDLTYGAGSHIKSLLKEFDRNPAIGKLLVIGPQKLEGFSQKIRFELIKIRGKFFITKEPLFAYACKNKLLEILKSEEYDLIHTHFSILASSFSIPLVTTFHTTHYGLASAAYNRRSAVWIGRFFHKLYEFFDKGLYRHSDRIVFVSQHSMNVSLARYPYLEGKSLHIPNGVDTSKFYPLPREDKEKIKKKYDLDNADWNILFVGRLEYLKGLSYLIEACRQIPGINLVIVGEGYLSGEVTKYHFIKHLKYIPNERMNEIYNSADVYILPSLYENFPSTILEAMSCGLPIIATPVGDVTHILPDTNPIVPSGDVMRLKEAIEWIIGINTSNRELLERIKSCNIQRVNERFSISGIAQEIIHLYETLITKAVL